MARFIQHIAAIGRFRHHWAWGLGLGVGITGLSTLALFQWADTVAHRYPFFCLYPAVIVSAWLGGTSAGSASAVVGAIAIERLWLDGDGAMRARDYTAVAIFVATGFVISAVQGRLQRTRDDLRASLAREAEANRLKDEFLANLSHELRTPLNVILGYSRMLSTRPCASVCADTPRLARSIATIESNAMAQMRIIEDLLDVERIVTGRLTLEHGPCDLRSLARNVIDSLLPSADAKKLHVRTAIEPIEIDCDGARIQQVLWNLLSNAIKFTPQEGCVSLDVTSRGGEVVIVVADSGEGIPAHFLPHVFERFRQLDMSTTRRHHGMGLGLAIVKHVVEAHGGTVTAESAGEGQGATFTIRLPATRTAQADEGAVASTGARVPPALGV